MTCGAVRVVVNRAKFFLAVGQNTVRREIGVSRLALATCVVWSVCLLMVGIAVETDCYAASAVETEPYAGTYSLIPMSPRMCLQGMSDSRRYS